MRLIEEICDTAYDAVNWGVAEVTVFNRASGKIVENREGMRHHVTCRRQ